MTVEHTQRKRSADDTVDSRESDYVVGQKLAAMTNMLHDIEERQSSFDKVVKRLKDLDSGSSNDVRMDVTKHADHHKLIDGFSNSSLVMGHHIEQLQEQLRQ